MKQNKYGTWAVGAFMLLLSAAACTDSYESTPVDMFTEDYLFSKTDSNGTVVRKYLNRIYYYMRNGHNGVNGDYLDAASDDALSVISSESDVYILAIGRYSASNFINSDMIWSDPYLVIRRVNILLSGIDVVPFNTTYTDALGNTRRLNDSMKAEARFLRALSYYWLVTEWGDVPLVLKVLESTEEVRANNYRRPKAEIYQAIFDDLKYVTESPLLDVQPASACGKVSKAAAWALWGKALLQQACDEDFIGSKSELLGQAIGKLTAAWDLRKFGELSSVSYSSVWDLSTQKSCAENLFQVNYIQGNADLGSVWNYMYCPEGAGVTSQRKGEMQNVTIQAVYDSFEPGDVRRSFLRATNKAGQTYYHTMKYADLECGANGYGGNNWIVLRYADVALMLAEAYYWSKEETLAKTWLNKVRERAGLGDWSGSDLRQGIYDERLHEFMQEGLRWQDLLRMYDRMEMLEHFSAINSNFSLKDLLLPIPYNERILNPEGLYQNPGYGSN